MAWVKVGETAVAITAGAGNQTITLPGTPAAGDLVLVATAADASCQNCIATGGYTVPENGTGVNPGANFGYKLLTGTPDTGVDIVRHATILRATAVQVWRGGDTGTILDAAWATPAGGTSAAPDPPSVATQSTDALVVAVAFLDDDDTTATAPSSPNAYTNLVTGNTGQASTTVGATIAISSRVVASPTTENPGTYTMGSSDAWSASTIAFRIYPTVLTRDIPSEGVKASDPITVLQILNVPLTESITVDDIGQGATQLLGPIRVTDGPIEAALGEAEPSANATESVRVSDTVATTLDPEETTTTETVKVSDSLTVSFDATPIVIGEGAWAQDDFAYTDGALASVSGGTWTALTGTGNADVTVSSGSVIGIGTLDVNGAIRTIWPGDPAVQYAEVRIDTATATLSGPTVHAATDGSGYLLALWTGHWDLYLMPVGGGDWTWLTGGLTTVEGHVYRLRWSGGTLTAYRDGVVLGTFDDSTIATGVPGLIALTSSATPIADWAVGDGSHPVIRISDAITATIEGGDLSRTVDTETGRVSDAVAITLDPEEVSPSEAVKVSDAVTANMDELGVSASETVRLTDSVSTTLDPEVVSLTETVRISDPIDRALIDAGDLTATVSESLKLDDTGQGRTELLGPIRVQDGPISVLMEGLGDVNLTESIRVQDGPIEAGPLDLSIGLTESITTQDASDSWAELTHDELVAISDPIAVVLTPLEAAPQDSTKVSDSVTATMSMDVSATETIRVSDTVSTTLTPLQTSAAETLRLTDAITALLTPLEASAQETIRISDSATVDLGGLIATVSETLRVTDSVMLTLTPEEAQGSETIRISDSLTASLTPLPMALTESVAVSDAVNAALDASAVSASETVRVSDSLTADRQDISGPALSTSLIESVKTSDSASGALDLLETSVTESLTCRDTLAMPSTAAVTVTIAVRPEATLIAVRQDATHII